MKRPGIGMAMTMGVIVTLALGVAAVWLSGDARAAGVVVMLAGVVASAPCVIDELRTTHVTDTAAGDEPRRSAPMDRAA